MNGLTSAQLILGRLSTKAPRFFTEENLVSEVQVFDNTESPILYKKLVQAN